MKVLTVHPGPQFSVADVHTGIVKGLEANGCEVRSLDFDQKLNVFNAARIKVNGRYRDCFSYDDAAGLASKFIEVACYEWLPAVVIIVSGMFVSPFVWMVLAHRWHHVVAWCTESPYEDGRQVQLAPYADTVILNDPLNIHPFWSVNPRTFYLPHSYDPDIHHPGPPVSEWQADFGFVGTGFPSRIGFLEDVNWDGLTARIGGNWLMVEDDSPLMPFLIDPRGECMDNTDTARLYNSVKVGANLYRREHQAQALDRCDGLAVGPREIEMAACGLFFLRDPRAESDLLFPHHPTFDGPDEFGDLVRWWSTHDDAREKAAKHAQQAVEDRTFVNTTARLLRLIDKRSVTRRVNAVPHSKEF